jgi:hypothetical protein
MRIETTDGRYVRGKSPPSYTGGTPIRLPGGAGAGLAASQQANPTGCGRGWTAAPGTRFDSARERKAPGDGPGAKWISGLFNATNM